MKPSPYSQGKGNRMKVHEFRDMLISFTSRQPEKDDCEVVVVESRPSLGGRACIKVSHATFGMDWEKNRLNIAPENPMVQKPDSMTTYDMASDLIYYLVKQGLKLKRKQWYHQKAIDIFKRVHGENFQEKYSSLFKD